MRLRSSKYLAAFLALGMALAAQAAHGQNPDNMMPEERTAKGKQVLEQLITALGGPTYLDIRESNCDGRLARGRSYRRLLRRVVREASLDVG